MAMPYLMHTGTPHEPDGTPHSGRYRYGSGDASYQRAKDFMRIVEKRRAEGITSDKDLAESMHMTTREFVYRRMAERAVIQTHEYAELSALLDSGLTVGEIAHRKGVPVSTMRGKLQPLTNQRADLVFNTADVLRDTVEKHKYVDVGEGVSSNMGISQSRFEAALQMLVQEGYTLENIHFMQAGLKDASHTTDVRVLAAPGVTTAEIYENEPNIALVESKYESPKSTTLIPLRPVESISSDRVLVKYIEDGGSEKDGIIELRPGVPDLSLGYSRYAQVRIAVDGTHYMKGMAMYGDNMPDGVDVIFYSHDKRGTPLKDADPKADQVLKPMKFPDEPNNPFGAAIKNGGQRGALNIIQEEGDWSTWSKNLPAQFLAKQSERLVKTQLDLAKQASYVNYEEIKALTNGSLKRKMLLDFADSCDTAAVNLKAHAMSGQAFHLLLPLNSLKENQVYAPRYNNGDSVVLIRFPHAGTFELPRLTVNNNNREGKKLLGDAQDAVAINPKVAQQLSGADFDGDTVIVIPDNSGKIITEPAKRALLEFDNKAEYKTDHKTMTSDQKGREMGVASNLITDMTIAGAPSEHIIQAVKYSMVVIDAEKHNLDWRRAQKDFEIQKLKDLYQPREGVDKRGRPLKGGGANTIISAAKSPDYVLPPKSSRVIVDPETGKKITTTDFRPGVKPRATPKMLLTDDAYTLVSKRQHPVELLYAEYANSMKALANQARLEYLATKPTPKSKEAAVEYQAEVDSLKGKIDEAIRHSPYERKAGLIADYKARTAQGDMGLTDKETRKYRARYLSEARAALGGTRTKFKLSDREWSAIQKGALGSKDLEKVFKYVDSDELKSRALPKEKKGLTSQKVQLARQMIASGHSAKEVADYFDVSVSTLNSAIYSKR